MADDLNTWLANVRHGWQQTAERHQAAAEKIRSEGPRRTAGPVARETAHANLDAFYDKMAPHELRAQRFKERVAAADKGLVLDHGGDEEAAEFRQQHSDLYSAAARQNRLKMLKPGQTYAIGDR
jgi:hypothetical protein